MTMLRRFVERNGYEVVRMPDGQPSVVPMKTDEALAELDALEAANEKMREFIDDVEKKGLRCDLTPTMQWRDAGELYMNFTRYLWRADAGMRMRAKSLLEDLEKQ